MQNRNRYLVSDQGGVMWSDYLATKKQLQQAIRALDHELLDHLPADTLDDLLAETPESDVPEIRKNERFSYMKKAGKWLKQVKTRVEQGQKEAKQAEHKNEQQASASDLADALLDQTLASDAEAATELEKSLPMLSVASFQLKIKFMQKMLDKMEEARQSERYLEVYEIRIQPSGKIELDELKYDHVAGAYQLPEKRVERPDFKIVTGGRRLKDHDDVVVSVSQEEYFALQELGATGNRETTLMASLINDYGIYRREIINNAIRFQVKTDTWVVKEQICQQAISRLRALQDIESAYGASAADINGKIFSYQNKITDLITGASQQLLHGQAVIAGTQEALYSKEETQWLIDALQNHMKGLRVDLAQLKKLRPTPDTAIAKKSLAEWLLKQAEHIIESGKLSAELVDISGKKGISKGSFSNVTANAFERARTFDFPPNGHILPQHQGIFDPQGQGNELVLSSAELASGERNTRNVLFAFACVKSGLTNSSQLDDIMEESHAKTVMHRGYGRLGGWWQRGKIRKAMDQRLEESDAFDTAQTIWATYYALRDKVRSTNESYAHAFKKVFCDMGKAINDSAVGAAEELTDVTIRFGHNIRRDFTHQPVETPAHLSQAIQQLHRDEAVQAEDKLSQVSECIAEQLPAFRQWNPCTLYSVVDNFLLQFGGFFIKKYEASPFIWTMATLLGALSGGTAVAGPAIKSFLMQCGCPDALANGFVNVSQAISEATTHNAFFQIIGTGSTVQQGFFAVLDTLATGADAFTLQAIAELKRNLPIALCVIVGSTFGGWALGNIQLFREEFGSVRVIAEFFTGLKFAGFGYEAVMHEPGERSALANTVASGMNGAYNLLRAAASLLQLIFVAPGNLLTCHPDVAKEAMKNFLRPWLDLTDTGLRFVVSSADAVLRCTTTMSRGAKAMTKAALETPVNIVAKSARILGLETVSKAIVKAKSAVATATDDNFARPLHNVTRSVRWGYANLITRDDMYLGANPLRLSHVSHSFCQTIKRKNSANQKVEVEHAEQERLLSVPTR